MENHVYNENEKKPENILLISTENRWAEISLKLIWQTLVSHNNIQ